MSLAVLGPLRLSHDDLWCLTWGEVQDLLHAYRYREYLDTRQMAQHAAWIMNATGRLKHPVKCDDLAGYWVDGRVLSKGEYHEHLKNRVRARKGEKHG